MARATVFDVAELAGVSIKTVSRVVNAEPHVRPTTREKVDRAIARLDYRPDPAARRLAKHRYARNL
jgi:LacI family transcriptional regulator